MACRPPYVAKVVELVALVAVLAAAPALAVSPNVVISQVYGGGGNSGATYKNDFIELFNRGSSAVSVAGWSVQYASATGTSWQVTNLSGTVQPGAYYLVQEAQGAGGTTNLPTPDAAGTIAMSATAGKVALVNVTTALSGSCPSGATIVDFVGFGTTANCYEGAGPTPAPTNTTAVLRASGGCTDTDSNSTNFASGAPNPRNSASPTNLCSVPLGSGAAHPSAIQVSETSALTMTVTPAANPASTGLAVTCDLSPIGGSAAQAFYDDGTHGDVTPADNVFTFLTGVAGGTTAGGKVFPCTITDAQSRTGNASINLAIVSLTKIHDIQGSGHTSPLVGQVVSTRGVVTALLASSFYIEEPDAGWDANAATSEAISVFTAPSGLSRGDLVTVTGTVQEYSPAAETLQPPTTELASVSSMSVFTSGNPLPTPVVITAADTNPAGGFWQLEKYEGMRATFSPSITVVGPTGGTVDEVNATSTSSGWFWGAVTGLARPFREAGANTLDANVFGTPPGACTGPCDPLAVPRFDGNPERFDIGAKQQVGGATLDVRVGDVLTGLVGPVSFTTSAGYRAWQFFPDPGTGTLSTPGPGASAVTAANSREFTVATFNMERFFDTHDDGEPGGAPVLTAAAYANRLNKASLAIRNYLLMPDIVALEEIENIGVLTDIANKVNADAGGSNPQYAPFLMEGNDIGGIDVGFLIKTSPVVGATPRVQFNSLVQENKNEQFVNPDASTELLNDRPPLLLTATINHANGAHFDLTLVAIHQKALSSVDSQSVGSNGWPTVGARNRAKRQTQARSLATLINARQVADPNERIVVLGDLNAFEFNDGYTDVLNITTGGTPQTLDSQAIVGNGGAIYTTPPLTDLISSAPGQRYSYSDYGSAQNLDHLMINGTLQSSTVAQRLEHARIDADFPETDRNDANSPRRLSDHDPLVGYFEVASFATADLSVTKSASPSAPAQGQPVTFTITASNGGPDTAYSVVVTDLLNSGFELQSSSATAGAYDPATGAWTIASIADGASETLTITALVTETGNLSNTATVSSAAYDPTSANSQFTLAFATANAVPLLSPWGLLVIAGLLALAGSFALRRSA